MAAFLFSSPLAFNIIHKPGPISCRCTSRKANWIDDSTCRFKSSGFEALKATDNEPSSKTNSILCVDCEGNGKRSIVSLMAVSLLLFQICSIYMLST
ncbi:hypothetical protein ACS0TY_004105 [Phlomoides rotata]